MRTHEEYIKDVAHFAVANADLNPSEREQFSCIKLVYGSGPTGTRGVTFYSRWRGHNGETAVPFVEVSAFGQESPIQIAGTTVHELAHVLAGWTAGHGKGWHEACERLGLLKMLAGGTDYKQENFAPKLWAYIQAIEPPTEGQPVAPVFVGTPGAGLGQVPFGFRVPKAIKGCQAGTGTRGGKSRGVGSGSRLRLYQCPCGQKIRAATDSLSAKHTVRGCNKPFVCQ